MPIFGNAVGSLFRRFASTHPARNHPTMTGWSCQRRRWPALIAAVVFAVLAVLTANRPCGVPTLILAMAGFARPRRNAIGVELRVLIEGNGKGTV